jgi:hypothetical protein
VKILVGKAHLGPVWQYLERDSDCPGEKNRCIGQRSCDASDVAVRLGGQALLTGYRIYTAIIWPEIVNRLTIFGK